MIWDLLRRTGSGSFREGPGRERLRHYLEGRSDEDVWHLARRIAEVFVVYSTYRLDWVLDWLGMHPEMLNDTDARTTEQKVLELHPDFAWQRDLWRELASRRPGADAASSRASPTCSAASPRAAALSA